MTVHERDNLRELADVVGGTVHDGADDIVVKAPAFVDSRKAQAGGLFVALPGERVDGHDYVAAAMSGGAAAVLAQRPVGAPAVVVEDGVDALGRLSAHLVDRGESMTVLGITGSAGKTTTKDLIAHLLSTRGTTVATPGKFNNEIGLPLTVSLATEDTRFLVLEMGARAIGHIKYLTEIAPPSIGIVTNIGTAHLGEFGGYEATTQGKGELVEALPPTGLAVLNADDERVLSMRTRTRANVVLFGLSQDADIRASDVTVDERGHAHFTLHTPEGSGLFVAADRRAPGRERTGRGRRRAAYRSRHRGTRHRMGTATPASGGRLEITERPDGIVIVNDAYNANPHSTRAALRALIAMANGRRTIVVLGAMLGLGDRRSPSTARWGR